MPWLSIRDAPDSHTHEMYKAILYIFFYLSKFEILLSHLPMNVWLCLRCWWTSSIEVSVSHTSTLVSSELLDSALYNGLLDCVLCSGITSFDYLRSYQRRFRRTAGIGSSASEVWRASTTRPTSSSGVSLLWNLRTQHGVRNATSTTLLVVRQALWHMHAQRSCSFPQPWPRDYRFQQANLDLALYSSRYPFADPSVLWLKFLQCSTHLPHSFHPLPWSTPSIRWM